LKVSRSSLTKYQTSQKDCFMAQSLQELWLVKVTYLSSSLAPFGPPPGGKLTTTLCKFLRGSVRLYRNDERPYCCISEHGKLGLGDKSPRPSGKLRRLGVSVIPRGSTHSVAVISWLAYASSCLEGEAMTRKIWILVIASILVSVILLESQVFATDADGRKKIGHCSKDSGSRASPAYLV
jgi:hypothetical protein